MRPIDVLFSPHPRPDYKRQTMNVEAFFLCDAATDQNGRLNVLGAFDNIWTKVPVTYPVCAVAARIRSDEAYRCSIKFKITDENNKVVPPELNGDINFKCAGTSNVILHITGMKFEQYGQYKIDLIIDGKTMASLPLYVKKIKGE